MSIEIEKKYRLTAIDIERIIDLLSQIGAVYHGKSIEENIIYGGGVLDEKKAVLRVRCVNGKTLLTYKRRLISESDIKRQIEEETDVSDTTTIQRIVEELGFTKKLVYEKRRQTWRFDSVELVLDELPFGHYMEIEGTEEAIRESETRLSLTDLETEYETYPALTLKFGDAENGIVVARFNA